jgi:leucyl aminopeptidase
LRVILDSGFRPKRTMQFMAYAAEEVGLRGSREIAERYRDEGKTVVAALQMDMTGFRGSEKDMYLISDYVNLELTAFLKELINEYNTPGAHQITFGETECGYGCSDHVSWTRVGVPAAFPFEAEFSDYNPEIHSPRDTISNSDVTGAHHVRFAKIGIEFMMEIAKNAGEPSPSGENRYVYTTLRVIGNDSSRGCSYADWTCMANLCKSDLQDTSAWRAWAGCWRRDSNYECYFECGQVKPVF